MSKIDLLRKYRKIISRRLWGAYYLVNDLCDMLTEAHNNCLLFTKLCDGEFEKCRLWQILSKLEKIANMIIAVLNEVGDRDEEER